VKGDAQHLKGHLDVLLLATLEDGPKHGYAIKEALRDGSNGRFDLPTGTIYPALHRLEAAGLITGAWASGEGRRRRDYQLTEAGLHQLHTDRSHWQEFAATISTMLKAKPWPATS
jgi:DNA-binding PadR family transcriptional regulator